MSEQKEAGGILKSIVTNPAVILFAVLYVAALSVLSQLEGFPVFEALIQAALFAIIFPLLAWVATRKAIVLSTKVQTTTVQSGRIEMIVLAAYIVSLSVYLIHGPQLIDRLLPTAWSESPQIHFFVNTVKKLVVFVAIPFLIFRAISGYRWRDYGLSFAALRELTRSHALVVALVGGGFLLFQYFLGGGAAPVRRGELSGQPLAIGLILCFVWLAIEAGLVEEFFFRGLVQSRLSAWFKSDITAVALMALIFGLAHAPGYIFRSAGEVEGLGSNPSALNALVYAIILAPSGILFGVVWARTRNLFAVIIIHAAGDLLPNVAWFVQMWP